MENALVTLPGAGSDAHSWGPIGAGQSSALFKTDSELLTEVITSYERFQELEEEWGQLLGHSRSQSAFLTHAWLSCWWEAFGANQRLYVACLRGRGQLVGAAPLCLAKTRFRGLPVRKLTFLANSYSEEADIITTGREQLVLSALFAHLRNTKERWDLIELNPVRHETVLWRCLADLANTCGLRYATRPSLETPYVQIRGDWESFLSDRSRNFRRSVKRRLQVFEENGARPRIVQLSSPRELLSALPAVLQVSRMSWKARHRAAISDRPFDESFFARLSTALGARGWVKLWLLYLADRPIAFEYHVEYAGITAPIRADFDEEFRALAPGAYLEYMIIRSLFEDPERTVFEYNTCGDAYAYLRRWSDLARLHARIWIFAPTWYGVLLHKLAMLRGLSSRQV